MTSKLATVIADFETQLASAMAPGATSVTIQSATDDDGNALPNGQYFFAIDGNNSQKEHIVCTLAGTSLTNIFSVSRQGVQTSGVVRSHRIGSSVSLTDFAHLRYINDIVSGATAFDHTVPLGYDGTASITTANQFATKDYVDGVAIAGAPDSSTTVKGISKLSTAPVSGSNPIVVGDNDTRVPTQSENDAMVGTSGTAVSSSNKLVDAADVSSAAVSGKIVRANGTALPPLSGAVVTGVIHNPAELATYTAGNYIIATSDASTTTPATSFTKVKEIYLAQPGTATIYFTLAGGSSGTTHAQIFKNGVVIGTDRSTASTSPATYNENITFAAGDLLQVYAYNTGGFGMAVTNFRIAVANPVIAGANVNFS